MTKEEILKGIDRLCQQCDEVTGDIVLSKLKQDDARAAHVHWKMESLIVACHQELSFLRDYIEQQSVKKTCFLCGHELIWNNDFDLSDVSGCEEDDGGVVSYYSCPHCGRMYEVSDPPREARDDEYGDYWNQNS